MPQPFALRLSTLSASRMRHLGVAAALLLLSASARSADSTAPAAAPVAAPVASQPEPATSQPEASASQPTAAPASAQVSAPRYSASNLERAFNYMDANRDGKVSRDEAAGFRGVARHFDRADTDHDNTLSRGEFERAMNHVKSK